ncbi:MAG: hypothetical protein ACN2B6_01035 [Rickettsiales bacterium]
MEFALFYGLSVLWNLADISEVALILAALAAPVGVVWLFIFADIQGWEDGEAVSMAKKAYKTAKLPLVIATVLIVITPSKDDLYFIAGGGLTLMAAQNEEVQKLPENTVKAVNSFLERVAEVEK